MNTWMKMVLGMATLIYCGYVAYFLSHRSDLAPNTVEPSDAAKQFLARLGFPAGLVYCSDQIKFENVICTARVAESEKTFALECSAKGARSWHGCVERMPQ